MTHSTDEAFGPPTPGSDQYLRLKDLDGYGKEGVELRVMEIPAVFGWERWTAATKERPSGAPVRWRDGQPVPHHNWRTAPGGKAESAKMFRALWVWNVKREKLQVLVFTQGQIVDGFRNLYENSRWGDPTGYSVALSRSGSGLETVYSLLPLEKGPLPSEAVKQFARIKNECAGLAALFDGGDPFAPFGSAAGTADHNDPDSWRESAAGAVDDDIPF